MENIFILQNEIENLINKVSDEIKATDDEKIIAIQLALSTCYKLKNTRNAYMTKLTDTGATEVTDTEKEN